MPPAAIVFQCDLCRIQAELSRDTVDHDVVRQRAVRPVADTDHVPWFTRGHSWLPRMLGMLVDSYVFSMAGFRTPTICQ